ncbi:MAG: glycoside hydrolase family 95-like protein [Bryobacteraceae bacterium]
MKNEWSRRDLARIVALGSAFEGAGTGLQAREPVVSAYSPRDGKWCIEWPGRLAQHDIIYLSPPEDPSLGLPIGNGDLGALLWTTDSQIILAINKCDAWDDNEARPFRNWGPEEEEKHTSLRHCGRLVIDFGCPVLDLLYQKDFEARLDLASAMATLRADTPFAGVRTSSYISAGQRVLVLRSEMTGTGGYTPKIRLERWGSRTFAHWYSQVNRDPSNGLDGTETTVENGRIVIQQRLRSLSFVIAAQVIPDGSSEKPRRLHSRAGEVELQPSAASGFTVLLTAVTSENDTDPVSAAHRILDQAVSEGEAAIRDRHREDWRKFWSASMVDLPEKYIENIWHVTLYLANSSSRGAYPPHFCNGLWGWNRDFVPWNYYFHWNMQWYAWPLAAANHPELALPYYRLRRAQLPHAVEYARQHTSKRGAFYSDVSDRRGYNDATQDRNRTPGAQIALDFWRHYAYTGDERFLRESAWPVICEVARFNSACLAIGPDGLYHISGTTAYEGSPRFDDTITDLAMIRALFPVAIRVGKKLGHDPAEVTLWEKQLNSLAPFHLSDLLESEYERRGTALVHSAGLCPGTPLASRKVFAAGKNTKGEWVRNRHAGHPELSYYGIPDPEIAPVFPGGLIGLAQRDTELFRAAVTQVRLHPRAVPDVKGAQKGNMADSGELCMGWCPYPIGLARLGLAEELVSELVNTVSTWQIYPQGFGHYGPYHVFKQDTAQRWQENVVRDAATVGAGKQPVKFPFPAWPFRHFDNEAMPIVSCAVNEMLLQSHDEAIRVFPAVPADWEVRFDLAAAGGFRVSAERIKGKTLWVAIESRLGGECRLVHPWPSEHSITCVDVAPGNKAQSVHLSEQTIASDRVISWQTVAGRRYLLIRDEATLARWQVVGLAPQPNRAPRRLKQAILGRERLF